MNEQDTKIKEHTIEWLLRLVTACPHIVQQGIGGEKFVEDLVKSAIKLKRCPPNIAGAIKSLLPFITIYPQVFQPGIGIEAYLDELSKAAVILDENIEKPKREN